MLIGQSQMGRDERMHGGCVSFLGTSLAFFFFWFEYFLCVVLMILLCSLQQVFPCVDIEFYHSAPGSRYSPNAPLATQTRWPPSSFHFTEISSISAFHSSNSLFHSAEMSSIPTLNSPPRLVILFFFLSGQTPAYDSQVAGKWNPQLRAMTSAHPPRCALSPPRKNNKNQSGTDVRSSFISGLSLPFLPPVLFFFVLPLSLSLPLALASSTARSKTPLTLVCGSRVLCASVRFLEPGAGSSCVQRGQYASWQSVIIPEGGVGGLHNAGWHLRKFKAAKRWRGAAVAAVGVSHKTPVSTCVSLVEQVAVETRRGFVLFLIRDELQLSFPF